MYLFATLRKEPYVAKPKPGNPEPKISLSIYLETSLITPLKGAQMSLRSMDPEPIKINPQPHVALDLHVHISAR